MRRSPPRMFGVGFFVSAGVSGAASCAEELQPFLQEFLELLTRATLEQHVPVGSRCLDVLFRDLDGNPVITEQCSLAPGSGSDQVDGTSASAEKITSNVSPESDW